MCLKGFSNVLSLSFTHFSADEEFDELCFEFGIELDEVVKQP